MAIKLYIPSTQNFSGKSAICVALMHRLQKDGFKVGYLKPFSSAARVLAKSSIDEDARFVKEAFKLPESLDTLAPVVLTQQQMEHVLTTEESDYRDMVKQAADTAAQGKDIVVMEGSNNFREGYIVHLSPPETVELLDARVVTVIGYQDDLQTVDDALMAQKRMGDRMVGVIINSVPRNRLDFVSKKVQPYLLKQDVPVLAVLPHERVLGAISVSDIVEAIGGELLCGDCGDELVENVMVSAMNVEHALNYFRRVTNKAVIVGGDRPDIQLAALETSTKALILTGNVRPNPMIEAKAAERGVAIILGPDDTFTTVEKVERFFGKTRIRQMEKVTLFEELLSKSMDFDQLYRAIGLK
ncbi:MAG: phosphotransacetylase family protein [Chloroflexi bacterium]|nr:MAG: phosphotransacetylase family protein [Chloroflexota bacterium]